MKPVQIYLLLVSIVTSGLAFAGLVRAAPITPQADPVARCQSSEDEQKERKCLAQVAQVANDKMEVQFKALAKHDADAFPDDRTSIPREIQAAQAAWKSWATAECSMEADLSRGTAGIVDISICRYRLATARAQEFERLMRDD